MKKITVAIVAGLALALSGLAGAQTPPEPPKAKSGPKVAPAPKAPYAMAWTSSSGSGSYLGVDISEVTAERVGPLKLKEERGVEITMVDRDAPAGKAGLKMHDVILEFNGARVEGEEQLRRMLREIPAGRKVTLGISRDGQLLQIEATLAARETAMSKSVPRRFKLAGPDVMIPDMPDIQIPQFEVMVRSYSRRTGMMVDNLTPQLGEFFGVKSGQGVLVRSVEKGSAAEAAGLKAGDVIVKVDNEVIDDRNDWNRVMRKKGGKISLAIVRDKREQTLTVTLPEVKSSEESRFFELPEDLDFDMDMDSEFNFQPQKFDAERLERAMRKLRDLHVDRIVDRQVRVQKTMAVQQERIAEKMMKAQEKVQKSLEKQGELLRKNQEKMMKKLEEAARSAQRI